MTPTKSYRFADLARKANLHKQGISSGTVALLLQIQAEPLPMQKRCKERKNVPSPSPMKSQSLGPLVSHKLAVLDKEREVYVTTEAGEQYINDLRRAGLIP